MHDLIPLGRTLPDALTTAEIDATMREAAQPARKAVYAGTYVSPPISVRKAHLLVGLWMSSRRYRESACVYTRSGRAGGARSTGRLAPLSSVHPIKR